jgi:hypothetical protein
MKKFFKWDDSTRIFVILVAVLAVLSAVNIFLPQGDFLPSKPLPATKWMMALVNFFLIFVLYGGLGYIGLHLSKKSGLPGLFDPGVKNYQRYLNPAIAGALLGLFLIAGDQVFSPYNSFGHFPHPPFPTSLVASINAGIGEEMIFRLFFISFWVWLISVVILKKKYLVAVFWVVSVVSAIAFAAGHLPAITLLLGLQSPAQIPPVLLGEIIFLNGAVGLVAAYYFKKAGFLGAVGVHFWTDVVWHVIWGANQSL